MASSRLERVGTIFSRVEGLLRSGAMRPEDRPIWWDIYRAFPPVTEPVYVRPYSKPEVRNIFYEEDVIRAKYHKSGEPFGTVNLSNRTNLTNTQKLIHIHKNLKSESTDYEEDLYEKCLSILKEQNSTTREERIQRSENRKLADEMDATSAPVRSNKDNQPTTNIRDIFD